MSQNSYIFIGRSGAGKGTQAKLLIDFLNEKFPENGTIYVETGKELRALILESNRTAQLTKEIYEDGGLMPSFLPVYLWVKVLKDVFTGKENLVFDGTPRKPLEAMALDGVFPFYKMPKPFVIYLDVEHSEAIDRLTKRNRFDDHEEEVKKRLQWFETDVIPTLEYYKTDPNVVFLDIDGNRSIEEIHADILKRVGL